MKNYLLKNLVTLIVVFVVAFNSVPSRAADHNIWPERVTEMTSVWDSATGYVTVTMTAPTNSMTSLGSGNGEPLPYLTKVVLSRNLNYGEYEDIYVFENPTPGDVLTYVDESAVVGLYQYKAVAYVDDYASYPEWSEITVGQFPVDINDAHATCNKGEAPVTLSFTAPYLDTDGNPLISLKRIEVSRYDLDSQGYKVIGNIENPYPGTMCTFDDADVVSGESYTYRLTPYTQAGHAYGTMIIVMVGLDIPLAPNDVRAEEIYEGNKAISWRMSEWGQTNGYIDVETVTYTIMTSTTGSIYDAEELVSNLKYYETYYVDETAYIDEDLLTYYVIACNEQGESDATASNPIAVGQPSIMPYVETFDSVNDLGFVTSDHPGWMYSSSETTCAWFVDDAVEMEDRSIETQSGEGGLAFAMYGHYNDLEQDDYMTTGKIALDYADVYTLGVDYYAFMGSNSTLAIEVSADGGEFEEIGKITNDGVPQERWCRYTQIVEQYDYDKKARNIQVRLHAHKGTMSQPIVIDNFVVSKLMPVVNLHYDYDNLLIKWDAPEKLDAQLTGYAVSLNGIFMGELPVETTQYDYSNFSDEEMLLFAVQAIYEDKYYSEGVLLDMSSVDASVVSPSVVRVVSGTLYVDAADNGMITVYSIDGTTVLQAEGSVVKALPAGVYVVKTTDQTVKVVM